VELIDLNKIEKNKDYTKFTEEIKGKVDLMQQALRKNQGFDNYLFSMGGIAMEPFIQLPPKVSIPKADNYNGSGDPKQHLRQYLSFVKMKGLNEIQVLNAFPFSLSGSASKWYYTLDMGKVKGWTDLVNAFLTQFSFNTMIDITLRDLETTKQKEGETFSEYLVRWRDKASKMINRPGEKDQVNIMMKGLLPVYFNRMLSAPIMNFEQLCDCGTRIEDAMKNGKIVKSEGRVTSKKTYGQTSNKTTSQPNVSTVY
jgi:hypothetical protein